MKSSEQAPDEICEEGTLSMISMKSLASGSGNARIFVRSSFDNKNERNIPVNSADLGSSGGSKCNPEGILFENSGPHECQTMDN